MHRGAGKSEGEGGGQGRGEVARPAALAAAAADDRRLEAPENHPPPLEAALAVAPLTLPCTSLSTSGSVACQASRALRLHRLAVLEVWGLGLELHRLKASTSTSPQAFASQLRKKVCQL